MSLPFDTLYTRYVPTIRSHCSCSQTVTIDTCIKTMRVGVLPVNHKLL